MAMNLLKAGHNVIVYNRTAQKAKPLADQGAHAAADPAEASGADVVSLSSPTIVPSKA